MPFGNQAPWDRGLRVLIGLVMLGVGFLVADDLVAILLRLFGWVPLLEGIAGWSPFYALLDIDTRRLGRRRHRTR